MVGASGGVGSYLLQLAALRGITAIAVGRNEHHDRLRRLGAIARIDYTDSQGADVMLLTGQDQVDAVAGLAGGRANPGAG